MTSRIIKSWIVPLKGDSFDLEDLPNYLDGSSVTVIQRDDNFFLQLSTTSTTDKQFGEAENFLALINGAASVLLPNYRPIELASKCFLGIDEDNQVAHTVILADSIEMRSKFYPATIAINEVVQQDPRKGLISSFLNEALHNRAKADALVLVGRSSPSWSELYLIYELVEANDGSRMFQEKWISKANATLFTRTANSYTALGREGRHGKDQWEPPIKPMERHVAVSIMRSLVASWFRSNSTTSSQNYKE